MKEKERRKSTSALFTQSRVPLYYEAEKDL